MALERFSDRTRLAVLAAGEGRRSIVKRFVTSSLYRWRFGGASSDRFLIVPQDLRTADPSFATEVYHGHFGLAGSLVVVGSESPFSVAVPNSSWARELYGFGWMRHLRASQDETARAQSLAFVLDWIDRSSGMKGVAWEIGVTARRVISWLSHAPSLLDDAQEDDYDKVMNSFGRQLRFLNASYANIEDGEPQLTALIALVLAGLCLAEREPLAQRFVKILCRELNRQIYSDGGHASRNPWMNVQLLLDLLPLKQCFVARDRQPPNEIADAVDRLLPMVRFMRLGDGYLGRFNGMAATLPDAIATVLSYDDAGISGSGQALNSGYTRLANGDSIILIDSGKPPPLALSGKAHAGCLSFEMSSGTLPIIVNSGAPGPAHQEWRLSSRATSAHSTLTIENVSSSRLLKPRYLEGDRQVTFLSDPKNVTAELRETAKGVSFSGSHDGFLDKFGVVHLRKMQLDPTGVKLRGEDQLVQHRSQGEEKLGIVDKRFAVHFHVHPDARVTRPRQEGPVVIDMPNGTCWHFLADGGGVSLAESLFLSDYRGPRQGLQIVVRAVFFGEARVRWTLEKKGGGTPSSDKFSVVQEKAV